MTRPVVHKWIARVSWDEQTSRAWGQGVASIKWCVVTANSASLARHNLDVRGLAHWGWVDKNTKPIAQYMHHLLLPCRRMKRELNVVKSGAEKKLACRLQEDPENSFPVNAS